MPRTTSSTAFASALSLLAITVGAVSAALVGMCIGMYVTIISVDTSAQVKVQAHAAVEMSGMLPVSMSIDEMADEDTIGPAQLRDALFREASTASVGEDSAEAPLKENVQLPRTYFASAVGNARIPSIHPMKRVRT